ncbi:basement membrane-specific heparan sulfate proteoglycan core protein isoform X8 [Photinus pyralis]|uniref:basement membrane-specific heparan sulfate proteoglycan core protein isoform X8 n=1 Tax=Photinus pyralis TaxID=7054 RepID=UPI00126745BB|nr:basement membrane-specific heparan sulfate proteoglycan core protein isoform X8 [Photinus pyralis]
MGSFKSSIPRLLWLYLVAAYFIFVVANTGYQVLAAENDGDLVFDNVEDSKLVSQRNRHILEKRSNQNNLSSKSSQHVEEDHWLTKTVNRIKRQWPSFNWFGSSNNEDPTTTTEQGQAHVDSFNDVDSNENDIDDIHPESDHHGESDDEDDLDDVSGSGGVETDRPIIPGQPVYYRVTMAVLEPFIAAFADRNTPQYREIAEKLVNAVNDLYDSLQGKQSATVIRIQKREADVFSSKVTMDLGTVGFYDHGRIRSHLYNHIKNYHTLGPYKVTTDEFSFREFEGSQGLPKCEPDELPCHSGECVPVSARCNSIYDCRDHSDEAGCEYNINEVDLRPTEPPETTRRPYTPSPAVPSELPRTQNPYEPVTHSPYTPYYGVLTEAGPEETTIRPEQHTPPHPVETTTESILVSVFNTLYNSTSPLDVEHGAEETTPTIFHQTYPTHRGRCRADDVVRCVDGSVICADQLCDGVQDCPSGDDENNCPIACAEGELSCDISRCIPINKRCDGYDDCDDRTDELDCPPQPCRTGQFRCNDGKCIEIYQRCDYRQDCNGGEDEEGCSSPKRCDAVREFRCNNGRCVPLSARCNRKYDCDDESDERNCPCKSDDFHCANGYCIPPHQKCDGLRHCQDGSDELNCSNTSTCRYYQFQCSDGTCIDQMLKCNKQPDCPDRSDEIGCIDCQKDQFRCNNGSCISISKRCDGVSDCPHSEDEESCASCTNNEKRCTNGECINLSKVCDGIKDCSDGSDELHCNVPACRANEFMCASGGCISSHLRCNYYMDCRDGSDEFNCVEGCSQGQIKCNDGSCIEGHLCDGIFDCVDASDERNCSVCNLDEFRCENGDCIAEDFRCDGRKDCNDGSDEVDCVLQCPGDSFRCGDGVCLDVKRRCDGYPDCRDNSDELGCTGVIEHNTTTSPVSTNCQSGEFSCEDGKCIPEHLRCDGRSDCANGIDEFDCAPPTKHCQGYEFTCKDGSCIPNYLVCDGTPHCKDGSDETECGCRADEYQCASGTCIAGHLRCNYRNDCNDGSDEINCGTEPTPTEPPVTIPPRFPDPGSGVANCPWGQRMCNSGDQCLPYSAFCNGRYECNDLSDETNCPGVTGGLHLKTYPNEQTIKESVYKPGREVVFQCRDEGPLRAKVKWIRGNGLPLPQGTRDNAGRLEIPNIQMDQGGAYTCVAIGYPPSTPGAQVNVYLTVEAHIAPAPRPPKACELHEATCSNGDCIAKHLVCNGVFDCKDGSDETRCSSHGCEPNEFKCNNKKCVLKTWRCDGDDDCGDGTDEASCATNPPGSPCQHHEFACHAGNQCIPKSYHCDHERDCADGSDEVGCSAVVIAKPPPPMVNLNVGALFVITCTAVGVPMPEVVWRLNWGHIPEKCTTTSVGGVGTLTCPNIQIEDQGAYSCEAINIFGAVFARPDTILVVNGGAPICPKGTFNEEARNQDECISCFCFGATADCRSADLFIYQLQPPFNAHKYLGVRVDPYSGVVDIRDEPIYRGAEPKVSPVGQNGVHAVLAAPYGDLAQSDVLPYFDLPDNFVGNQLKSYGGYLKYKLRYDGYGRPLTAPDVILTGNGYTLLHIGNPHQAGREEDISVRFFAGEWVRRSPNAPEAIATREDIMMVLENVEHILIKLQYVDGHLDTALTNIDMDSAAVRNTGLGQAIYVEQCSCPAGYSGLSCESCAPGFSRHKSGPWLGQCYKEVATCQPGTYGDPSNGIPCRPCPCPLTDSRNQFGHTCQLESDGQVTCQCPPGYVGRRCEQCSSGYTGNPLVPGDYCKPGIGCNPDGSLNYAGQRCDCKQNTYGPTCNQCKPNTFHLSSENQFGCIACFCMGITQQCTSSNWYRDSINIAFTSSQHDVRLVEALRKEVPIRDGIRLDQNANEIVYSSFNSQNQDVLYWSLPSRFLGDKISAYGGYLRYTIRYVPTPGGQSSRNTAPDVELISENHINLLYFARDNSQPNTKQTFSVPLLEQHWQRSDGQKVDREHLLMALADLQAILIKATYTTNTLEASLISVSLDVASERNTGRERALAVEQCQCPAGYRGLSCEDCDVGYTRAPEGIYLGLCELCSCNGHSNECDPETGACFNCRDHTSGANCEQCLPGFELDPRTGECKSQAQTCECNPAGALSSVCVGGYCHCKTNVEGPRCDHCRPGTFGLNHTNPEGCQKCFCSGITDQCVESNFYIEQLPSQILSQDHHGFSLTSKTRQQSITSDFLINVAENKIGYTFRSRVPESMYWTLPPEFKGDQIKSYGGRLEFTQQYSDQGAGYSPDQDVIISGNDLTIYWTHTSPPQPNRDNKVRVPLSVGNWQRVDWRSGPQPASRADILTVLAHITEILVRATLSPYTTASYISDIALDTAVEQYTGQPKARDVEVCRCPPGYRGTSCELCAPGYYRDINDLQAGPLGSCTKCPCSGNEESCNLGPDNRVVCHCLPGYTGPTCSSIEQITTTTETIYTPPPPPVIVVEIEGPQIKIVEVGQTVRLYCSASSSSSSSPVQLKWYKDGGHLAPNHAIDDGRGILVITDVVVSDSGNYVCQASDGFVIVTQYTTVTVGPPNPAVPPTVSITPSYIQVQENQQIEVHCVARGNPAPSLQWRRVDRPQMNERHSFINGVFRIPYAQKSDEGQYECVATNSAGVQGSTVYIQVFQQSPEPAIKVTITPAQYYGKIRETFSLTCDAPRPWRSMVWSREDGQPLPYSSSRSEDERVLTVYDAKLEDSGTYVCSVTAQTTRGNGTAYVSISAEESGEYPKVSVDPTQVTVDQGSTIELRCEATGVPAPTIQWTRVTDPLGPNAQQIGSVLKIQNVQIRDRGVYVCVASNRNGVAQSSSIIEVERREAPVIEIHPSKALTVTAGGSLIMQCRIITGSPQPSVHWSRPNGQPLSNTIEQLSNGVLRFTSISLVEAGEYMCTAENTAGKTTAIGHLEVHTQPSLTISPRSGILNVREGEYVRLECRATGVPQPTVQWSKQFVSYSGAAQESHASPLSGLVPNVAVYEITRVTSSDQGYYVCQGQNSAGTAEERVSLVVDSVPERGDITVRPGEDGSAGNAGNEVTQYPPYVTPRVPYKDNEHIPTYGDKTFTAPVGTRAELRCQTKTQAGSDPLYVNWVRGENSTLPENSVVRGGTLFIDNVQPTDGGEYRCLGVHPSGAIVFSFSAHLVVVSPPRITLHPPKQVVRPGDNAHIECAATGQQPISITWTPVGREMPASGSAEGGNLRFIGIQISDAGRYRCTAINSAGEADAVADVVVQDYHQQTTTITAENRQQVAAVGTSITLHCVVRGGQEQPPSSIRWFREHLPLSPNSHVNGDYLQIVNVRQEDGGRYFCEVAAEGGTASDYIDVHVQQITQRCSRFEWRCDDGQCISERRRCDRKYDCRDRTDELYCLGRRRRDQATDDRFSSSSSSGGSPLLDIQSSSPTCRIGDTVDLYCRSNEPGVITSWSKVNGRFEDNIQTSGGTLRFSSAIRENAGTYRCEARGSQGVYSKDYVFEVIDPHYENVQGEQPIETKTAPQGSSIVMECRTDLQQPVMYQWSKPGGVLHRDISPHSRTIQIDEVKGTDAGTYVCTASNSHTSIDIPTILVVTGIVPYFAQAPNSFIALPTLPDAYIQFTIEVSFKPEVQDGLILFNGHKKSSSKTDFIALALVNGVPTFYFNLGQGVTTVRANSPIQLGQWHSIKVSRNRKRGTMYVDGKGPFTGVTDGKFVGLDLNEPLYIGGVPNFRDVPAELQIESGFVGCISRLKIGHAHQDIIRDAINKDGITTCETCSENPCHNQGVCQEALTAEGYTCLCQTGYSGPTCNKHGGEACTPYACGPGRCIDTENNFKCLCPLGRAGRRCEQEISVYEPAFSKDAYIAYPTPRPQRRLKVSLKFKARDLRDGILLYCAESEEGHGDFASLSIKDRHVEFRFDVGSDPVVIRSDREVQPGEWIAVTASKFLNEGRLLVNGDAPVTQRVPGNHKALNLQTSLYVGGIDKQKVHLNHGVGVDAGFDGCISEISVSGLDLNIIQSVSESANIEDCSASPVQKNDNDIRPHQGYLPKPYNARQTGCSSNPCRNDGQCYPLSPVDYQCNCVHGYSGRNCEIAPNLCDHLRPCLNGGSCHGNTSTYSCGCPMGYTGTNCEQRADIRNEVNFNGNGYVELNRGLLNHKNIDENEVIAFELSTNASNGLIFWHGQRPTEDGRGKDYISLAVVGGYLEYSFELGSGPAIIYNNEVRINDGERHRVILKRRGRWGSIEVDNDHIVEGNADGYIYEMNCNGNIYLGGTPNNTFMTGGRYSQGFSGCIYGFEVQDSRMLDIGAKAVSGVNVKPCSSGYGDGENDLY